MKTSLTRSMEAGQIYENMLADPALSKKGGSASTKGHSKTDQRKGNTRSPSDPNPSSRNDSKGRGKGEPKLRWANNKDALQGINQADIDKHRAAKVACWRCGRDNHQTLHCFANKDVDGKEIPAAPKNFKHETKGPPGGGRTTGAQEGPNGRHHYCGTSPHDL